MSSVDKAKTVSRERRDCAEHALPVPRATLADREARELGIEPLDARTLPAFAKLGGANAPFPGVLDPDAPLTVREYDALPCRCDTAQCDPHQPQCPLSWPARSARAYLAGRAAPVKRCKACGGGAAYLEKHPELDYCTPQCEAYGAIKVPTVRISSVLDIPLSRRAPIAAALLEHATVPALAEDRAASAMFDGDAPPVEEPVVDVADYVSGLERDAQAAHLELQRVTAENSALRTQLIAALDRVRELESARREGGV